MRRVPLVPLVFAACLTGAPTAQEPTLRTALGDAALGAEWVFDDLAAGFAKAKETGRPLLVAFR